MRSACNEHRLWQRPFIDSKGKLASLGVTEADVVSMNRRMAMGGDTSLNVPMREDGPDVDMIEELVAVGLISPDVRGRYSQQNLRTVRLAMEITRKGVPLRNLRAVRASAEREADTIDQAVAGRRY